MSSALAAVKTWSSALAGSATGFGEHDDVVAEDHQRRDRADVEMAGQLLLLLGVDLGEPDSGYLTAAAANTGANARHGAHHGAQKSTTANG
jgi:hypothetical protein